MNSQNAPIFSPAPSRAHGFPGRSWGGGAPCVPPHRLFSPARTRPRARAHTREQARDREVRPPARLLGCGLDQTLRTPRPREAEERPARPPSPARDTRLHHRPGHSESRICAALRRQLALKALALPLPSLEVTPRYILGTKSFVTQPPVFAPF